MAQSDRPVPRRVMRPLEEFMRTSTAGAVLLLGAVVAALVWTNSPWRASYYRLWNTHLVIGAGSNSVGGSLTFWVNDGLMALFFFVVGLEVKRELTGGELREWRAAALPILAAIGGMVVPAAIYVMVAGRGAGARGWGIPMATDVVFALAALTLAARFAPPSLKPILLTLAIVDDIGALVVIAVFYGRGLDVGWLLAAAVVAGAVFGSWRLAVRSTLVFVALGVALWYAVLRAGLQPAIAGAAMGLLTPEAPSPRPAAVSPLARSEHLLLPWTTFVILPVFALANSGVGLERSAFRAAASERVAVGIFLGLVLGKLAGVFLASSVGVRTGFIRLPEGAGWAHLAGLGGLAGVGFTVSLFIAALAFPRGALLDSAKISILVASVTAGMLGYGILRLSSRGRRST